MAMTTRCLDPRGLLAGALWPYEPNPHHKLNVFIITAKLILFPRLLHRGREAGHAQTNIGDSYKGEGPQLSVDLRYFLA